MSKILMEAMQFTLYLAGVVTLLSFSHLCHVIALLLSMCYRGGRMRRLFALSNLKNKGVVYGL